MTMQQLVDMCKKYATMSKEQRAKEYVFFSSLPDDELNLLILPNNKSIWEISAEIIQSLGYPKIKCLLPRLLIWLQDVNWPGANIIINVLSTLDKKEIMPFIEDALITAAEDDDQMWIGGIKWLVENLNVSKSDFSSPSIYALLELSDF